MCVCISFSQWYNRKLRCGNCVPLLLTAANQNTVFKMSYKLRSIIKPDSPYLLQSNQAKTETPRKKHALTSPAVRVGGVISLKLLTTKNQGEILKQMELRWNFRNLITSAQQNVFETSWHLHCFKSFVTKLDRLVAQVTKLLLRRKRLWLD